MSKKEKKEKKEKKQCDRQEQPLDLYGDLPDGLLEALADERLSNAYAALYITLGAFIITVLVAFLVLFTQYKAMAELVYALSQTTAVHIPSGAEIDSYTGTINAVIP